MQKVTYVTGWSENYKRKHQRYLFSPWLYGHLPGVGCMHNPIPNFISIISLECPPPHYISLGASKFHLPCKCISIYIVACTEWTFSKSKILFLTKGMLWNWVSPPPYCKWGRWQPNDCTWICLLYLQVASSGTSLPMSPGSWPLLYVLRMGTHGNFGLLKVCK